MEHTMPLYVAASKLSSVMPVGIAITAIGAAVCVAGWIWLIYQNARFDPIHGVLSLLFPPYALIFAFVGLEHRFKSEFTAAFLGGALIAGLGYSLVFAADDCENNPNCGLRIDYTEAAEEEASDDDSSALERSTTETECLARL